MRAKTFDGYDMNKIKHSNRVIIPGFWSAKLKLWKTKVKIILFGCVSKSARLSAFYYALFSNNFIKEQHRVMSGIYAYHKRSGIKRGAEYVLRRNIHRLEKGLLMKARRPVFAVDFIGETLASFEQVVKAFPNSEGSDVSELVWAYDVLQKYFNVVASVPAVDQARIRFHKLPPYTKDGSSVPYKRKLEKPPSVSYDELFNLSLRRRSVRWYRQQPVPRDLLDQAMVIASLAPSACNRQAFEFRVFDDPNFVLQISSLPGGASGFRENIPVLVVVVGKLYAYFNEQDRHLIYIDSSLAVMSFMYALETLGLSSCGINWHASGVREEKMTKLLGLSDSEQVVMLMSVGYPDPDGMVAYSQKKELDFLRRYN